VCAWNDVFINCDIRAQTVVCYHGASMHSLRMWHIVHEHFEPASSARISTTR
jgi:hypothetical protein